MKRYGSIYKITNKINGHAYIGQTIKPINRRWNEHKCGARYPKMVVSRAIKKYGPENFNIEEICTSFDKEELNQKETYFINFYNTLVPNGYNTEQTGFSHGPRPESVKDKIRKSWTVERREIYSKLNKGHKCTVGNTSRRFPILVIHLSSGIQYPFEYNELAAKQLNLHISGISVVLNKKRPHHKGFTFKILTDIEYNELLRETKYTLDEFKKLAKHKERAHHIKCIHVATGKEYEFNSALDAANALNLCDSEICRRLNGKRKGLHNGYRFIKLD